MGKKEVSLYDKEQKSLDSVLKRELSAGLAKEAAGLIPFFGGLMCEWIPSAYRYFKGSCFIDFMRGFGLKIDEKNIRNKDVTKLKKKLEKIGNYKSMSAIIDGVFFSKSVLSRMILGVICAIYIEKPTIPYEDMIIIAALKDTLDVELIEFVSIYDNAKNHSASAYGGKGAFYFEYNPENTLTNTTFFKFKSNNLIGTFENPSMVVGNLPANISGVMTSISDKLYNYIGMVRK